MHGGREEAVVTLSSVKPLLFDSLNNLYTEQCAAVAFFLKYYAIFPVITEWLYLATMLNKSIFPHFFWNTLTHCSRVQRCLEWGILNMQLSMHYLYDRTELCAAQPK